MKNRKVLILAGGLGTRLRPLTFAIPKPLIPVRGRPIIDYIISGLIKFGFNDIYVSLNYCANIIKLYLMDKYMTEINIHYFEEKKPLGTAGPLSIFNNNNIKIGKDESILVINGDILTNLDFGAFIDEHKYAKADLTVGYKIFSHVLAYGVLDMDESNEIIGIKEKPELHFKTSAGIYLVKRKCLDYVPDKYFNMPELIEACIENNFIVKGSLIKENWLAIEQIANIEEAVNTKKDWISKL